MDTASTTAGTAAVSTSPRRREIVFKGQLQQRVHKKFGTLLRKKKCFYEDELWVVLCVHEGGNGGIPHLEWYGDPRSIFEHEPVKVQDLLECQYVNVAIGEERCMVIGFVDKNRPMLEMSAPSIEERQQWIDVLTRTLRRLNCLIVEEGSEAEITGGGGGGTCPRAENEYISIRESDHRQDRDYADQEGAHPLNGRREEGEEEPPHVSLSTPPVQGGQQGEGGSLACDGAGTPTTSRRARCLMDPIPMFHRGPSSFQPTAYLTPAASNNEKEFRDNEVGRSISPPLPLPRHKLSPQQISCPSSSTNFNSNSVSHKNGKESHGVEEENDDENSIPPPLPPRSIKSPLSVLISTSPKVPTSPIPSSPPQKLQSQYDVLNHPSTSASVRSQYDQLCPVNDHLQYQQIACRLSSESYSDRNSCLSKSSCSSSSARNSVRRQSTEDHPTLQQINSSYQQYDVPCRPAANLSSNNYDQLQSSSTIATSAPQPMNSSSMQSPTELIFRESLCRPRRISFSLTLLVDVAFVELVEKVWVAGWSPKVDANLRDILCFGDEVVSMNGVQLGSVQQLPEIYANIKPGVQIELVLRSNPAMKIFTLVKPANSKRDLGIVLHRGKNKVASIEPRSVAERSNLCATMPAYFFQPIVGINSINSADDREKQQQVQAVITQLNGIPLNPFARNDQFFHRLDKLPTGQAFNVTLHPADFCKRLSLNMKSKLRDWRQFVHDL